MKQFYKIGEISRLYQIGPDSLRYYEKLGLLTPRRGENDYRMYGLDDLWRLNVIRDLRRLDFPMEKIQKYMNHRSVEATKALLNEELSVIDRHILALEQLKSDVSRRLATLEEAAKQPMGEVISRSFPRRRCHIIRHPYHTDEEMDMLIKQLLNKDENNLYIIGNNRIGSLLPLEEAQNAHYNNYEGVFIIDEHGSAELAAGDYLTVSYHGDSHQHRIYFPLLHEYARKHNLTLCGPILEFLWVDIHQAEDVAEHITELQVRVKRGRIPVKGDVSQ